MRALAVLALLAALPALASAAGDEPPRVTLRVGEERTPFGIMPRCDDLSVVTISADGRGVKGLRPGETLCSFDVSGGGGARRVWRFVVLEAGTGQPAPRGG